MCRKLLRVTGNVWPQVCMTGALLLPPPRRHTRITQAIFFLPSYHCLSNPSTSRFTLPPTPCSVSPSTQLVKPHLSGGGTVQCMNGYALCMYTKLGYVQQTCVQQTHTQWVYTLTDHQFTYIYPYRSVRREKNIDSHTSCDAPYTICIDPTLPSILSFLRSYHFFDPPSPPAHGNI